MLYLGLDMGTTTIAALVLDVESGEVVTVHSASNGCEVTSAEDKKRGRSEREAEKMFGTALDVIKARPFMVGGFLLVGAGLVGGRSYAWLRDFFRSIGQAFYNGSGDEDLYEAINRLAADVCTRTY